MSKHGDDLASSETIKSPLELWVLLACSIAVLIGANVVILSAHIELGVAMLCIGAGFLLWSVFVLCRCCTAPQRDDLDVA